MELLFKMFMRIGLMGFDPRAGFFPMSGGSTKTRYQIQRSLRLRASATAYLSRTFVAGTRTTWTWSGWVKRGTLGVRQDLFSIDNSNTIVFSAGDLLYCENYNGAGSDYYLTSSAVFRDPSAWYHIVVVWDSNNATAADRQRMYVNGTRITSFSSTGNAIPSGALSSINDALTHNLGRSASGSFNTDGYLAEVNFVGGQALTPSSFGQIDPVTGQWTAKKYIGTYGTNGFYLDFNDASSTTNLCLDRSGNGNNWTPNNISLTAGATYDSMTDVPLAYGTTDRGNYATLNPLNHNSNISAPTNGNLYCTGDSAGSYSRGAMGTMAVSSGKWYWETSPVGTLSSAFWTGVTLASNSAAGLSTDLCAQAGALTYRDNATKCASSNSGSAYGASYTLTDVIGHGLDLDAGTLTYFKNGVSQGVAFTGLSGAYVPLLAGIVNAQWSANFGQRPFAYTPPTGFKALHTGNLPEPAILLPSTHMRVVLDTGANIKTTTEAVFPGNFLEWIKDRANSNNWQQIDSVRGASAVLQSNTTAAETTYVAPSGSSVGIVWKAGGAAVTNNAGSISSQVSANVQAGLSVVTFPSNASGNDTVGHGLGVRPSLVIAKAGNGSAFNWAVWHTSLANDVFRFLRLNTNDAEQTPGSATWGAGITSSVVGVTNGSAVEASKNCVLFCFSEVPGYSRFGSVVMNASTDGSYFHTGFSTRFLIAKRLDAASSWFLIDTVRQTYNVLGPELYANFPNAESIVAELDVTANGIKFRNAVFSGTWALSAFAESPFKYANAR